MTSSLEVLNTLAWVRAQSFIPVPLKYKTKEIQTAKNSPFPSPQNNPEDILWQNNQLNIGVVTGPIAHGPIDIDLDCPEAATLAPFFLPNSAAIFGRSSRANSHYLYKVAATAFPHIAIQDPSSVPTLRGNKNILELRGDNNQTMMPGSIHPNGESIQWYSPPQPLTDIDVNLLKRQANLLGAAVLAARYIWLDGERHESAMQIATILHNLKYSQDETSNFITALIRYSGSDDPAHLATVRTTYARLQNDKPTKGAASLQARFKDSNPLMAKSFLRLLGYNQAWLDELNERYACVLVGSKYKIVVLPKKANAKFSFLSVEDFKHRMAGQVIKVQKRKKDGTIIPDEVVDVPTAELWLRHSNRLQYDEVEFLPGVPQEGMPSDTLNEWTGWALQPLPEIDKCKSFRNYVENYLTDPKRPREAQWVYTFFAHVLREPENKQRAALVIIGPQKIGKSVFVNYFGSILGRYHLNLADASKIHGRFNYHLKNCLLLHSEEAVFGGDKKHRAIIKDFIANKSGEYEEKYMGIVHAKSYGRLIYSSNELRAAPLEIGDTRHSVFNFNISKRIPPRALVEALYAEAISDGPAALMHFLQTYDNYAPDLMGEAIMTREKAASMGQNLDFIDEYWLTKLINRELFPEGLRWAQGSPRDGEHGDEGVTWPKTFSRTALYTDYLTTAGETRSATVSAYRFYQRLAEWIGKEITFKRVSYLNKNIGNLDVPKGWRELFTGVHQVVSGFPSLDKCRKSFEKYSGLEYEWDELAPESEDDASTLRMIRDAQQARF